MRYLQVTLDVMWELLKLFGLLCIMGGVVFTLLVIFYSAVAR